MAHGRERRAEPLLSFRRRSSLGPKHGLPDAYADDVARAQQVHGDIDTGLNASKSTKPKFDKNYLSSFSYKTLPTNTYGKCNLYKFNVTLKKL